MEASACIFFDFDEEDKKTIEKTLEKVKYFFKQKYEIEISKIEALEEEHQRIVSKYEEESQLNEIGMKMEIPSQLTSY